MQYRKTTRNCIDYIKTETLYHYVFYSEKKKKAQLVIYCNMTTSMKHIGKNLEKIPTSEMHLITIWRL